MPQFVSAAPWFVALALCVAPAVHAQIFSPGALSKAHKDLDGVTKCVKCHEGDGGYSNARCLECHKEIARRLDENRGYHAEVRNDRCAECHVEHRGLQADLIVWKPKKESFNHLLTGWPLQGPHKDATCKDCHNALLIEDPDVLALVADGRESMLGVSTRCVTCHFDEHRGQEGAECQNCHTTTKFKEAPRFKHNDSKFSKFALTGKHKKVECRDCHFELVDNVDLTAFPKPRSQTYLKLADVPHASCADCHDDVHFGDYGTDCVRCHTTEDFKVIKESADNTGFHDKYAFKLRGKHTSVACRDCHGPFPGEAAKYNSMKFRQCSDCHFDAHAGQLKQELVANCDKCHSVNGFRPVLFNTEMHKDTRFALEGSHQAIACNLCHKKDARLSKNVPASARAEATRKRRQLLLSDARLRFSALDAAPAGADRKDLSCEECHSDPHDAQFEKATEPPTPRTGAKECATCHTTTAFTELKFEHKDSRFPLTGKHEGAACASCHAPTATAKGERKVATQFRGLGPECQGCHVDAHVGQLAKDGRTDCASCHQPTGFKGEPFDHDKKTTFALEGKHRETECKRCHPSGDAKGATVTRYKPVPKSCEECHTDPHEGAHAAFGANGDSARCETCHSATGWRPASFPHEKTAFPLTGRHQGVSCRGCHTAADERKVPTTCAGCHTDPHAQEFGSMCASCHTTDRFDGPAFSVDAHRRTLFPLTGRHAMIPCEECHGEKRDRTYSRATVDCASCHAADARQATLVTLDHQRAPVSTASCRACHTPTKFVPARYPQHDVCFPITRGSHVGVKCVDCHIPTDLPGSRANGNCRGVGVRCIDCHAHQADIEAARHQNVAAYEHKSAKCAACHHTP